MLYILDLRRNACTQIKIGFEGQSHETLVAHLQAKSADLENLSHGGLGDWIPTDTETCNAFYGPITSEDMVQKSEPMWDGIGVHPDGDQESVPMLDGIGGYSDLIERILKFVAELQKCNSLDD